MYERKLDS